MYTPNPNHSLPERVAAMEVMLGDLHENLLGNGQPGRLTKLEDRLGILEHLRSKAIGILAFLAAFGAVDGIVHGGSYCSRF